MTETCGRLWIEGRKWAAGVGTPQGDRRRLRILHMNTIKLALTAASLISNVATVVCTTNTPTARSIKSMWLPPDAAPPAPASSSDTTAKTVNDRLYSGQLAAVPLPWMDEQARREAAAAPAGRAGARGLTPARCGVASFRPLPGAAMYRWVWP